MKLFIYISTLIVLISCHSQDKSKNPIKGLWKLHAMEIRDSTDASWSQWRDGMQGYLLYDGDGHMALHLTTLDYEKTPLSFPNFNDSISLEALKHLTKNYNYHALYALNEKDQTVTHSRISHSNPREWNAVVVRSYRFHGDTLIISPQEERIANLRLKWLKFDH